MHRMKKHKIKQEAPESSTSIFKSNAEHDLAYYIHDRVELMHQVFSVIKPKELKAMAPQCVQHISIDDLQELCTEELLGISSKRLCAILDGADPPTDTESSGSEPMETISLDSISSDDEILSQHSSKGKKHKHKKHKSKSKHKRKNSNSSNKNGDETEDRSKASRAGLTVLELLELQARARAIRAQLQQDNNMNKTEVVATEKEDSSDEVEIKEEPPEVVEISSEDEKPSTEDLNVKSTNKEEKSGPLKTSTTVKRINNLIITLPQSSSSKKIKLKRNQFVMITSSTASNVNTEAEKNIVNDAPTPSKISNSEPEKIAEEKNINNDESKSEPSKTAKTKKRKKKAKAPQKDGSDHDEITLQLSDTEKMDLLENFDRKNYDNLTSSSSKDSESSSDSSESESENELLKENKKDEKMSKTNDEGDDSLEKRNLETCNDTDKDLVTQNDTGTSQNENKTNNLETDTDLKTTKSSTESIDISEIKAITKPPFINEDIKNNIDDTADENMEPSNNDNDTKEQLEDGEILNNEDDKDLSDGEIQDKDSVENEPLNTSSEVVCISDEDNKLKTKKNKKKDKKPRKEKKCKKSKKDFHKAADQNYFETSSKTDSNKINLDQQTVNTGNETNNILIIDDDDIYEILELSDDDSETEGESVLSQNPTTAEIEALSAKIDEINEIPNEDIVIENKDSSIKEDTNDVENVSWKDRYLGSNKVKKVLTTANILNALRKKNKELKKKIEESKHISEEVPDVSAPESNKLIEGSIEHFNTLEGSTKYVDPVVPEKDKNVEENKDVTNSMRKDAKLLLKMYKKLLKYNDMNRQSDPNKKKKKKQKKNKEKEKQHKANM